MNNKLRPSGYDGIGWWSEHRRFQIILLLTRLAASASDKKFSVMHGALKERGAIVARLSSWALPKVSLWESQDLRLIWWLEISDRRPGWQGGGRLSYLILLICFKFVTWSSMGLWNEWQRNCSNKVCIYSIFASKNVHESYVPISFYQNISQIFSDIEYKVDRNLRNRGLKL